MRSVKKGATDQSVVIRIVDATDGTPETGVAYNPSGIDLWYRREGATKTSITEASLSALNDAHTDGGILHIGDGYYRLDLPDAAVASGANGVVVGGTVTGMIVIGCYVHLLDYDPQDAARLGLSALQPPIAVGTLPSQSGVGTGQVKLASGGIGADDQHVGKLFVCYSAPGVIRGSGLITDSVNSTDTITLNGGAALDFTPTSGDTYAIIVGAEVVGVTPEEIPSAEDIRGEMDSNSTKLASIETDTQDIQSRLPAALVSGRMDSSVGAMASNVMTAAALASDAVTEIQSGLATSSALATVDGIVDAILEDTGTTLPGTLSTIAGYVDSIPADILDATSGVETGMTVREALRIILASAGGKLSGANTTTVTVRNPGDTKNRIVATVDEHGNRSAVTLDAS